MGGIHYNNSYCSYSINDPTDETTNSPSSPLAFDESKQNIGSESTGAAYWGEGTHFNFGCSSQNVSKIYDQHEASGCVSFTNQVQCPDTLCFLLHIMIGYDRRWFSKNQIECLHAIFAIPRDIFWPQLDSAVAQPHSEFQASPTLYTPMGSDRDHWKERCLFLGCPGYIFAYQPDVPGPEKLLGRKIAVWYKEM